MKIWERGGYGTLVALVEAWVVYSSLLSQEATLYVCTNMRLDPRRVSTNTDILTHE